MDDQGANTPVITIPLTGTDPNVDYSAENGPSAVDLLGKGQEISEKTLVGPRLENSPSAESLQSLNTLKTESEDKAAKELEGVRDQLSTVQAEEVTSQQEEQALLESADGMRAFSRMTAFADKLRGVGMKNLAVAIGGFSLALLPKILETRGINISDSTDALLSIAPSLIKGGIQGNSMNVIGAMNENFSDLNHLSPAAKAATVVANTVLGAGMAATRASLGEMNEQSMDPTFNDPTLTENIIPLIKKNRGIAGSGAATTSTE